MIWVNRKNGCDENMDGRRWMKVIIFWEEGIECQRIWGKRKWGGGWLGLYGMGKAGGGRLRGDDLGKTETRANRKINGRGKTLATEKLEWEGAGGGEISQDLRQESNESGGEAYARERGRVKGCGEAETYG